MIDGNISMEEDTELRDLVVQTLENNGVLAKVRAELRASVFLALDEQESVMNPEPLLNKTVKQYLSNSEGKLLFSLVREFLEYFGLDYTISVYDPETYFGKEYNYIGRSKLCEELGINSTEPLLGEILKSSMNSALNNTQKNQFDTSKEKTNETVASFTNTTFEVSVPKMLHNESPSLSNDNDSSVKLESISEQCPKLPINVTITDKKNKEQTHSNVSINELGSDKQEDSLRENTKSSKNSTDSYGIDNIGNNNNTEFNKLPTNSTTNMELNHATQETELDTLKQTINRMEPFIKFDESVPSETGQNEDVSMQNSINNISSKETHIANNVHNKKPAETNFGKTVYFGEIIVSGKKESVSATQKESLLGDLPPLEHKTNSIFSDLPPLNGKKPNINDLKELMDIGLATDGVDNYEEDFMSSASGSANEQSPSKEPDKIRDLQKLQSKKEEKACSRDISEEIDEIDEVLSSASCVSKLSINQNTYSTSN